MIPRISKSQNVDSPKLILNWGCGHSKSDSWINLDYNQSCGPDFAESITRFPWDWETGSIDKIILNHVIEHISKGLHNPILIECNRVLKDGGELFMAYPEFTRCATSFIENKNSNREFYEWTIFGRQTHSGDFHVCAVTDNYMKSKLLDCGFAMPKMMPNDRTPEYTDLITTKFRDVESYETAQGNQWRS